MLDRLLTALFLLAVIAAACAGSSYFLVEPGERSFVYAVDTMVEQANQPTSPTEALAATSARIDTGSSSTWPIVALLLLGVLVGGGGLLFMNYGEGFLKQYRLWSKKRNRPKPAGTLSTIPRNRPMLPSGPVHPDDVIIEGELWQD